MSNISSNIPMAFVEKTDFEIDNKKYIKLDFRLCHDGLNPNKSFIDIEDIEKEKETCKNIPILANVCEDEDGNLNFGSHDWHLEPNKVTNESGDLKYIYDEKIVGIIPETNNWRIQEYNGKNYAYVSGYIFKDYSNYCEDLILQNTEHKISMEIDVDKYSVDAKSQTTHITDFTFRGVTLLNPAFGTGMKDARATLGEFSQKINEDNLRDMIQDLNSSIKTFAEINNTQNGGLNMENENTQAVVQPVAAPVVTENNFSENTEVKPEAVPEPVIPTAPEKFVRTFELSHENIKTTLYTLLSARENENNTWYYIEGVYDGYFDYFDEFGASDICYRQSYSKNGNLIEFSGEPVQMFVEKVTQEERNTLEIMRNNYNNVVAEVEELRAYKLNAETAELNSKRDDVIAKWSAAIGENEAFAELQNNKEKYSVDELEKECKCIFADAKANFEIAPTAPAKENTMVRFSLTPSASSESNEPYGGIFKEFGKINN